MAIRFASFEQYKSLLADKDGKVSSKATFLGVSNSITTKLAKELTQVTRSWSWSWYNRSGSCGWTYGSCQD